jgi:hypothetical protein
MWESLKNDMKKTKQTIYSLLSKTEREREREVVVCLADSGGIAEHLSFCN